MLQHVSAHLFLRWPHARIKCLPELIVRSRLLLIGPKGKRTHVAHRIPTQSCVINVPASHNYLKYGVVMRCPGQSSDGMGVFSSCFSFVCAEYLLRFIGRKSRIERFQCFSSSYIVSPAAKLSAFTPPSSCPPTITSLSRFPEDRPNDGSLDVDIRISRTRRSPMKQLCEIFVNMPKPQ